MAILIVEGTDLAGKTYVIERIAKFFNSGFILKNTYKPHTSLDTRKIYAQYWNLYYMAWVYNVADPTNLVLLDRFYPSQAVYSIKRGRDEIDSSDVSLIEAKLHSDKTSILYLDTPLEEMEKRYDKRGDEHIRKEELKMLKERYELFLSKTKLNVIRVNTMEENWFENLVPKIEKLGVKKK